MLVSIIRLLFHYALRGHYRTAANNRGIVNEALFLHQIQVQSYFKDITSSDLYSGGVHFSIGGSRKLY